LPLNISDNTRDRIRDAGVALMVLGGLLAAWGLAHFDQLPNYLRLLSTLPFFCSVPMACVEDYRNWESLRGYWGGKAIAFLLAPFVVAVGALIWYLVDPSAKA